MKNFVDFLGYEKTRLFAFEIYWPLEFMIFLLYKLSIFCVFRVGQNWLGNISPQDLYTITLERTGCDLVWIFLIWTNLLDSNDDRLGLIGACTVPPIEVDIILDNTMGWKNFLIDLYFIYIFILIRLKNIQKPGKDNKIWMQYKSNWPDWILDFIWNDCINFID